MEIEHDREGRRFVKQLPEGKAELTYAEDDGVLDLQHTFVPSAARGKGVGGSLAARAFDHARAEGLKVRPTCPFVQGWVKRNPERADLVA